ncbi:Prenylated rab acceptor [Trema orientale]|uniref:PRA1 family protein n=1 Tax=Trema orientale TaxID=63057 RepID=A0A2P5ETN6_TREOI|nr:Prenylated rab acceptor [Trema orientale]
MRPSESQSQSERGSTATYTTIPISPGDVISRSFQNLSAAASRRRPWPEFVASSALDRPPRSLSHALDRIRTNAKRFRVNYAILVCGCAAVSLVGTPFSLVVTAAVVALWLLLYWFREDPLVVWGHQLGDRALLLSLLLLSIAALTCLTNAASSLLMAAGVGITLCALHSLLMNPDAFFLDEDEAASANLIHPQPPHPPPTSTSTSTSTST